MEAHHFVLFSLKSLVSTLTSPERDMGQCVQADMPAPTLHDRTITAYRSKFQNRTHMKQALKGNNKLGYSGKLLSVDFTFVQ